VAPSWKRGFIYAVITVGMLLFVVSIGLPVYLYLTTNLWWVDIAVCTFGTYWIAGQLMQFDTHWIQFESILFLWKERLFGEGDLFPPSDGSQGISIFDKYSPILGGSRA
tara:strand:+ start:1619 stop:1945 length:327 start_codon:yes stop_codon:yes gene_type:complete